MVAGRCIHTICPRELGGVMFAHYLPLTFPKSYISSFIICIVIGNSLTKWLHYSYIQHTWWWRNEKALHVIFAAVTYKNSCGCSRMLAWRDSRIIFRCPRRHFIIVFIFFYNFCEIKHFMLLPQQPKEKFLPTQILLKIWDLKHVLFVIYFRWTTIILKI